MFLKTCGLSHRNTILGTLSISCGTGGKDPFDFIVSFFASDYFWRRSCEVRPMSSGFFVRFQEGVMEDRVYPHLGRKFQFTVSGGCPEDFEGSVTSGCQF